MLVSGAVECPIDGQGRILIPPHLREHASLERDVTFAGVGARIEIWSKERYEGEIRQTRERVARDRDHRGAARVVETSMMGGTGGTSPVERLGCFRGARRRAEIDGG